MSSITSSRWNVEALTCRRIRSGRLLRRRRSRTGAKGIVGESKGFFDPTPEQQNVILIDGPTLRKAERLIEVCEGCDSDAEIPFDNILDRVTGCDPIVTEYI